MEPIKQAIERAKQERQSIRLDLSREVSVDPNKSPHASSAARDKQIQHFRTREVEVSARQLLKNRVLLDSAEGDVGHAYRALRTQVLQQLKRNGWNVLAVTSPADSAGKTLTSINLALSLARDLNHTVLLVDLDLRKPTVHRYLDFEPERGISDYLINDTPVEDILVNLGIERLTVLPGREVILNSAEMLSSPRMTSLLKELRERYSSRVILLDMPPVLLTDDVVAFAPYVDACLLVIEAGGTKRAELKKAMKLLERTNVLGTVLNKSRQPGRHYYYY